MKSFLRPFWKSARWGIAAISLALLIPLLAVPADARPSQKTVFEIEDPTLMIDADQAISGHLSGGAVTVSCENTSNPLCPRPATWCQMNRGTVPPTDPLFEQSGLDIVDGAMLPPATGNTSWTSVAVADEETAQVRTNASGQAEVLIYANVTPAVQSNGDPVPPLAEIDEYMQVDARVYDGHGSLLWESIDEPYMCPSDTANDGISPSDSLAYVRLKVPYFAGVTVVELDVLDKHGQRHFTDRVAMTSGHSQPANVPFAAGIGARISDADITTVAMSLVQQFAGPLPSQLESDIANALPLNPSVSTNVISPTVGVTFGDGVGTITAAFTVAATADYGICKLNLNGPVTASLSFTMSGLTVVPGAVTPNVTGVTVSDTGICDVLGDIFTLGTPENQVLTTIFGVVAGRLGPALTTLVGSTSLNLPAIALTALADSAGSGGLDIALEGVTLVPGAMVATASTTMSGTSALFASHIPFSSGTTSNIGPSIGTGSSTSTVAASLATFNQAVKSLLSISRDCLTVPTLSGGPGAPIHDLVTVGVPISLGFTGTARLTSIPIIEPDPTETVDAIMYVPGIEVTTVMSSGLSSTFGADAKIDINVVTNGDGLAMIELGNLTATRWTPMSAAAEDNFTAGDPAEFLVGVVGILSGFVERTVLQLAPSFIGGFAANFVGNTFNANYGAVQLNVIEAPPVTITLDSSSNFSYHLSAAAPAAFGGGNNITYEWNATNFADFASTTFSGSGPTFSVPIPSVSPMDPDGFATTAVTVTVTSGNGCLSPPKVASGSWIRVV